MNETKQYETWAKLRDFFNAAAEAIDELIQTESKSKFREYDTEKIPWQTRTGDKGEYEAADLKECKGNTDFEALLEDLRKVHTSGMTIKPYFYWLFNDRTTIGRKKTQYSQ